MSRLRNINMKSSNLHNFHYKHVRLHIITPPHNRVIVPEHQTRSAVPPHKHSTNPRDVSWQRVIAIQTGLVCQGSDGCQSHKWAWAERVKETSLTQTATMLYSRPIPSLCDWTLGPRTPDRHLTKNTIPLWSAYLSGAGIPIRATNTPILELHIARSISNNDCWLAIGLHQNGVLKTIPVNSYTRIQEVVARLLQG